MMQKNPKDVSGSSKNLDSGIIRTTDSGIIQTTYSEEIPEEIRKSENLTKMLLIHLKLKQKILVEKKLQINLENGLDLIGGYCFVRYQSQSDVIMCARFSYN